MIKIIIMFNGIQVTKYQNIYLFLDAVASTSSPLTLSHTYLTYIMSVTPAPWIRAPKKSIVWKFWKTLGVSKDPLQPFLGP